PPTPPPPPPHLSPFFAPDDTHILYTSTRHGSYDVFVVSSHGGKPRRLTFDSASDMVTGWSPDGKQVLFASSRSTSYPPSYELYTVPVTGGVAPPGAGGPGAGGGGSPPGGPAAPLR